MPASLPAPATSGAARLTNFVTVRVNAATKAQLKAQIAATHYPTFSSGLRAFLLTALEEPVAAITQRGRGERARGPLELRIYVTPEEHTRLDAVAVTAQYRHTSDWLLDLFATLIDQRPDQQARPIAPAADREGDRSMPQQHSRQGVIYGVTNWKGGVGKTTTAFNIAAAAAALGLETLLVDLDPQGSSGIYAGLDPHTLDLTITERILRFTDKQVPREERLLGFDEGIYRANGNLGFWVLPSSVELAGAESKLRDASRREEVVKALLTPARERFDFIVLDSSSSLGELKKNMMVAADKLLIPVEAEFLAVRAMAPEIELIRDVIWDLNPSLQVAGVILTKVDRRNKLTNEMVAEITAHFAHLPPPLGAVPILGQIPRSVRVAESPQYGLSMLEYQPESPVTRAYREIVARLVAAEGWTLPAAEEPVAASAGGHHE